MFINVKEKKAFLNWLVNHVKFKQREILWILNYLANHEAILANVHFVEQADKTERGIKIRDASMPGSSLTLYLKGKTFTDSEQIFHEIRLNWKDTLYFECLFEDSWQNSYYLSILEDNPFAPWNEHVSPEVKNEIDSYFEQLEVKRQVSLLYRQIDKALEDGNQDAFIELSEELNRLKFKATQKTE